MSAAPAGGQAVRPAPDPAGPAPEPGRQEPAGHDGARLDPDATAGYDGVHLDPAPGAPPEPGGEQVLAGLRRQARQLVAELDGPVRRIRLRSGPAVLEVEWHPAAAPPTPAPATLVAPRPATDAAPAAPLRPAAPEPARNAVRAPIVGTFYRAPEPGAAPFVAVGDLVRAGQVVGIVEAMKLMNEVCAERAGRVVAVLAEDGQPVEYDQPLIELGPA
jgi:acetyl-CoA carboxylase biotin carboxyl carrier protein